jgi:FAD/FMN-containing dehydrogenase
VANADGTLTKAGGRVVKNVAGYDLNKLYTGSLGTVGVIVELSFKLHPLPQQEATVVAIFPNPELAAEVSERVLRSPLGPTAIEIVNGRAAATIAGGLSVTASATRSRGGIGRHSASLAMRRIRGNRCSRLLCRQPWRSRRTDGWR